MGNNVKSDIVVLSKTGKVKNRYHLSEPQYGITYFGKSVKGYEFILMNKWHEDEGGIESEKIFLIKQEKNKKQKLSLQNECYSRESFCHSGKKIDYNIHAHQNTCYSIITDVYINGDIL